MTLAVPFTADQLVALGVSPDQLVAGYWDEATGRWKPVPNVTVVTQANGDDNVYVAVDHFTDFALTAVSAQYRLFLPQIVH